MRRVLVHSPDLLFYSQVKGTALAAGWAVAQIHLGRLPDDGVDGDAVIIDATRDLPKAWAFLDSLRSHRPWLVLVAHQHLHPEVGEEALHRGATEAVRRGAILSRLAQRIGGPSPDDAPFTGKPPGEAPKR
ncbi:MAG TPA: hypothetical protein VGB18_06890 [Candidatus Thermoplasmatota archaeon]